MSVALSPGGVSAVGSVDSSVAMQDLVRLQLQLQSRIASVRNASENDLSYHAIQAHNMAIKELFTELEEKLELWKRKSDEAMNHVEGEQLKAQVKRHQSELSYLKDSLRKANLKVKMERDKQYSAEKQRLLGISLGSGGMVQGGDAQARRRQVRTQEDALKDSKNVIEGLKRLRNMMASEVELGQNILVELDDQGKVINSAVDELDHMHSKIRTGKGWLNLLRRREVTDRLMITMAIVFFAFVCFYIVKVRLRITFFGYWP